MSYHSTLPTVGQGFNGQPGAIPSTTLPSPQTTGGYSPYAQTAGGQHYQTARPQAWSGPPVAGYGQPGAQQHLPPSQAQQHHAQLQQHAYHNQQQFRPQPSPHLPSPIGQPLSSGPGYPVHNGYNSPHAYAQQQYQQPTQPPQQQFVAPHDLQRPAPSPVYSHQPLPQSPLPTPQQPPSLAQHRIPPPSPQITSTPSSVPKPGGSIQINIPLMKTPSVAQPGRRISSSGAITKPSKSPRIPPGSPAIPRSPALSSAAARSPTVGRPPAIDSPSVLIRVADELLGKAQKGAARVATSGSANDLNEYHKLLATGLGCLEAAISTNKLPPRVEARARLRYAGLVIDETEDLMEAETMLSNGISLSEKHLFTDLKYCMHHLLMKVLLRRSPKAALVALDKLISECNTLHYVQWSYAFRFQKATFFFQSSNPADALHAVESLKSIADVAQKRRDHGMYIVVSLLEGLAHLRQGKADSVERVRGCIAQASKYQLEGIDVPQIEVLWQILDLACSLREKKPLDSLAKIKSLTTLVEGQEGNSLDITWASAEVLLPVRKEVKSSPTVSNDTSAIVRAGAGSHDFVVLSFMSRQLHAFALTYALGGISMIYKQPGPSERGPEMWLEGLEMLGGKPLSSKSQSSQVSLPLQQAMCLSRWTSELKCYLYVLLALNAGNKCEWGKVLFCVKEIDGLMDDTMDKSIQDLAWYLKGVCCQGRRQLDEAMAIYSHERFALKPKTQGKKGGADGSAESTLPGEIPIIVALNRLWIMQHENFTDIPATMQLVEDLIPICPDHPDPDVKTAFNLVMSTITMKPEQPIAELKRFIQGGLKWSQENRNLHFLSIALNVMRLRLFEGVVGEQALKSARAASAQAKKVGNILWQSVADGMLAASLSTNQRHGESSQSEAEAINLANESLSRSNEPPRPL